MQRTELPPIVIVPGLRDHVADHWQTLLADKLRAHGRQVSVVPPLEHDRLDCAVQVAALERTLASLREPALLVAHSAGVLTTVHWARRCARAVHGALLAAPPDFDHPLPAGYPDEDTLRLNGWTPAPRAALRFPSIVAASRNDPLARFEEVAALASAWGSRLVDLGNVGHLNPAAGYGEWSRAEPLIQELSEIAELIGQGAERTA
ncbi:RBBP9/YdeN family alpha/beta hydrolase [Cupriavidus basilensis]|uniref:RBBP9/YdeN family alpha/beta hydrolase n=1 Tax=Cupriavidus basilensis TaxID=68895 RepID=UPI0006970CAB|nr:alpha/beta hydrolase [Cupriavidus basilensis]